MLLSKYSTLPFGMNFLDHSMSLIHIGHSLLHTVITLLMLNHHFHHHHALWHFTLLLSIILSLYTAKFKPTFSTKYSYRSLVNHRSSTERTSMTPRLLSVFVSISPSQFILSFFHDHWIKLATRQVLSA